MNILQQFNNEMAAMVGDVRQSLVRINHDHGNGAGTIWHQDGLILTNAHVVKGYGAVEVVLPNGDRLEGQTIAFDPERDLAALAIDAHDLPTIEIGKSSELQPGQWVAAVGHPWGVMGAVTGGIVMGHGHEFPEFPLAHREWVMVNLHLRPGNSGGPLVDIHGRLVGVNTIMTGFDMGGAVPVDVIKKFLRHNLA